MRYYECIDIYQEKILNRLLYVFVVRLYTSTHLSCNMSMQDLGVLLSNIIKCDGDYEPSIKKWNLDYTLGNREMHRMHKYVCQQCNERYDSAIEFAYVAHTYGGIMNFRHTKLKRMVQHVLLRHSPRVRFCKFVDDDDDDISVFRRLLGATIEASFTRTSDGRITSNALICRADEALKWLSSMMRRSPVYYDGCRFSFGLKCKIVISKWHIMPCVVGDMNVLFKNGRSIIVSSKIPFVLNVGFRDTDMQQGICRITCRFSVSQSKQKSLDMYYDYVSSFMNVYMIYKWHIGILALSRNGSFGNTDC